MMAAMMTIFLLSLIGVPLTGGFFGKFYIFKAALDSNLVWLTVLGLLNSAVAAYYYLRVLVVMYMKDPECAGRRTARRRPGIEHRDLRLGDRDAVPGYLPVLRARFRDQIRTEVSYGFLRFSDTES